MCRSPGSSLCRGKGRCKPVKNQPATRGEPSVWPAAGWCCKDRRYEIRRGARSLPGLLGGSWASRVLRVCFLFLLSGDHTALAGRRVGAAPGCEITCTVWICRSRITRLGLLPLILLLLRVGGRRSVGIRHLSFLLFFLLAGNHAALSGRWVRAATRRTVAGAVRIRGSGRRTWIGGRGRPLVVAGRGGVGIRCLGLLFLFLLTRDHAALSWRGIGAPPWGQVASGLGLTRA
jgi:hypothetical protein